YALRSETIVQTGAYNVGAEVDVGCQRAATRWTVHIAKIDVQVFDLCRPWTGNCRFQAAAKRPPDVRVAAARETRWICLDVAERNAARDVGHEAVERVTDATTDSAGATNCWFHSSSCMARRTNCHGSWSSRYRLQYRTRPGRLGSCS